MKLESFDSDRLEICRISKVNTAVAEGIVGVLSGKATQHLPDSWSNIIDSDLAASWLLQRLSESDVFTVSRKNDKSMIGLLIISGLRSVSSDLEVRIGYIISEKYWGQGFASELVCALVCNLSKIKVVSSIVGGVTSDNYGSMKVLTNNGFYLDAQENGTEFYRYRF